MRVRPLAAAFVFALSLPASAADWSLTDVLPMSARTPDLAPVARSGANSNRFGFYSDLTYDSYGNNWYALSDRGPGGGVIGYSTRLQQLRIDVHPVTGKFKKTPRIVRTIIFTDKTGKPFNGLNPKLLNGDAHALGRSFDPEGIAISRDRHFFVSDEYGPSIYEFNRSGRFVRALQMPENLIPRNADGTPDYSSGRPDISSGRQDNRGFEGLTFNASGTRLYAVLQDPLVNEGVDKDGVADGRYSRWVRIVAFDPVSGKSVGQYAYPLETVEQLNSGISDKEQQFKAKDQGRAIGLSAITALSDDEFLVLERDNRGLGVEETAAPAHKRIYRINLRHATDIGNIALAGRNTLPDGVVAVSKREEVDLLAQLRNVGSAVPEKLEGLAFGPRLANGGRVALVGSDNDYSVTQTGSGEQFDVCVSADGKTRQQVSLNSACPAGMDLIPGYLLSFKVR